MTVLDRVFGAPLATAEAEHERIGVLAGIPVLGLDGLASSAYGPEAALTILLPLGAAGLGWIQPITVLILLLLGLLYLSYRQTIAAYPTGGGAYTVARENLGTRAGLLAAAALMVDYVLNAAVGISAGVGALVSAVPALHPHILGLCLLCLALITLINLRGARESALAFGIPTFLFVGTLLLVLAVGSAKALAAGGHPTPIEPPPALPAGVKAASLWLLLRAFASGCTAMTGVEAVSNGVTAFRQPAIANAQRTLTAIVAVLAVLLAGIAWLAHAYGIGAMDPTRPGYQSVISQLVAAVVGRGVFYYVTVGSALVVLALSANTSFAGFPRLARLVAHDRYLPQVFAHLGRRLVYSAGIVILAAMAGVLLIVFGGITDRLIPLFAVGAFSAFSLSQAGMVRHWHRVGGTQARVPLAINAVGAAATTLALGVILVAKFAEGAWITIVLIPALVVLFLLVRSRYDDVARRIASAAPVDLTSLEAPMVVLAVDDWDVVAARALHFSLRLSTEIIVVHVATSEAQAAKLQQDWERYVDQPMRVAGLQPPGLRLVLSPYRGFLGPFLRFIGELKGDYPERILAVVIPELVPSRWYDAFLHNQQAAAMKALLFLRGGSRVVVIHVPWHLEEPQAPAPK